MNNFTKLINEIIQSKVRYYRDKLDDAFGELIENYIDKYVSDITDLKEVEAAIKKSPYSLIAVDIESGRKLEDNYTGILLEISLTDMTNLANIDDVLSVDNKYFVQSLKSEFTIINFLDWVDNEEDIRVITKVKDDKLEIYIIIINAELTETF